MKYYSEETVKGLFEQLDSHFVKYLDSMPSIEIEEPHGRLVDIDRMIRDAKKSRIALSITNSEDLADLLESYADLDCKIDHTIVLEASEERE